MRQFSLRIVLWTTLVGCAIAVVTADEPPVKRAALVLKPSDKLDVKQPEKLAELPVFEPLILPADADGSVVDWRRLLTATKPEPGRVRATVRQLTAERHFRQASHLMLAALGAGQGQPWMFEGLALALDADGGDRDELLRAVLSAVDLAPTDAVTWLRTADYLARLGFRQQALDLFRQAADADESRPEPFARGLELARELEDQEAFRWAVIGMLSRSWPEKYVPLWEMALEQGRLHLTRLRGARRFKQAEQFEQELEQALIRDCLVFVSWTGEADIDLSIEEPVGSICSYRHPHTAGGGMMWGDAYVPPTTTKVHAETRPVFEKYVCPKAFDGTYRIRLRRIWGQPTARSVKVDVYTNWGTPTARHLLRQIELDDRDAVIVFDLAGGRRNDLAEVQVAEAARQQAEIRERLVLSQIDYLAQAAAGGGGGFGQGGGFVGAVTQRPFVMGVTPVVGANGGIGYMPNIVVLNEGVQQSAVAVVSANRRYVRISSMTMVSAVTGVTTFNIANGAQTRTALNGGGVPPGIGGGGNPFP